MRRRRMRRAFWGAFFAGTLVMGALYAAALWRLYPVRSLPPEAPAETAAAEPLTILIARRIEAPRTFLLLRLDAPRGRIAVALLPASLALCTGETLGERWREADGPAAASALAETLEVPVDRYLSLPDAAVGALLDTIGSVDLAIGQKAGNPAQERRIFDGTQLLLLFDECDLPDNGYRALLGTAARAILEQRLPLLGPRAIEAIYRTAVNRGLSDLTAVDYAIRSDSLVRLCAAAEVLCIIPPMEDTFGIAITPEGQNEIRQVFSSKI